MLILFLGKKAVSKDVCYRGSEVLMEEKSVSQIMVMMWMI